MTTSLDLPALHTRPSASTLLGVLESLHQDLNAFEGPSVENQDRNVFTASDIPRYLTSIVSSSLAWILDEDTRDAIWTAASQRLSERAGRSAQPTRDRVIAIPDPINPHASPLHIHLHEPTLTSDDLGHKTWAAGYLLAKRIPLLSNEVPLLRKSETSLSSFNVSDSFSISTRSKSQQSLYLEPNTVSGSSAPDLSTVPRRWSTYPLENDFDHPLVLELGSGTGLVGLALAHSLPSAELHLTDLPSIVPNLVANVNRNYGTSTNPHPSDSEVAESASPQAPLVRSQLINVFPLDWYSVPPDPTNAFICARTQKSLPQVRPGAYDLVMAADVLYGAAHPPLVARAAACFLKQDRMSERCNGAADEAKDLPDPRVVIEVPLRERHGGLVAALRQEMKSHGLRLRAEGTEQGWDEIGDSRDGGEVQCWWGVWGWHDKEEEQRR